MSNETVNIASCKTRVFCGISECSYPDNLVKQTECSGFIYNSSDVRCIFLKPFNLCDFTPEGYNNVNYYNEERKK